MARSFYTLRKDAEIAAHSAIFSAAINLAPADYGLTLPLAASYAAKHALFASALAAIGNPALRTTPKVIMKNRFRTELVRMASELGKIIDATPTVSDAQRAELGLNVRAERSPAPLPGTCSNFKAELLADGSVGIKWRANNPRGLSGVSYQVYRRLGSEGEFTILGASGLKKYVDWSIPVGAGQVQYRIRGIRPTAVGEWAQFDVNFGRSAAHPVSTQAMQPVAVKRAA